jgi:hypothetical protein
MGFSLTGGTRALQMDSALRYDSYDTSNIIQQYRDINLVGSVIKARFGGGRV